MKRKIVGVLGTITVDDENDQVIALYEGYRNALIQNNCIPFMISPYSLLNNEEKELEELKKEEKEYYQSMVDMCDGILIQGGYQWYPFDKFIVNDAIEKNKPVLGICLGMQLLACLDNGDKNEESLKLIGNAINHKQPGEKYAHEIELVRKSKLSKIIGKEKMKVNSKHRYCVKEVTNFMVSAYSKDGVIEAIEHPDKKFVLGVQWHPEKMIDYDDDARKIFTSFVDSMNDANKEK